MTNKIYRAVETSLLFQDSGGDIVISLNNLSTGAGRISGRKDRGVGSIPIRYRWRAVFQTKTGTNPTLGTSIELYLAESDGTLMDGTLGTADAALTTDKRKNLMLIDSVIVDVATPDTNFIGSGIVEIYDRYFSIGVWNATNVNLKDTANISNITLTPMPDELQ